MSKSKQAPPSQMPEARRARYDGDPDYRERAIQSTRRSYRKRHGRQDRRTCLKNLVNLDNASIVRGVEINGRTYQRVTFTVEELANVLNRRVEVVYRWIRNGTFPEPEAITEDLSNQHYKVYTLREVKALVWVMGEHQQETPYYRQDHDATRERLFKEFGRAQS